MRRKNWPAVRRNERKIRTSLDAVRQAHDDEFPDIAVDAMRALLDIDNVGYGTATLLLTLARPDRLLSLNARSRLYRHLWYKDGPPTDEGLVRIRKFRAALVDAFVCEPT